MSEERRKGLIPTGEKTALRASANLAKRGLEMADQLMPPIEASEAEAAQTALERQLGRGFIWQVIPAQGKQVVVIADNGAALIDLQSLETLWERHCPPPCGALGPNGLLALGRENFLIELWDIQKGKLIRTLEGSGGERYTTPEEIRKKTAAICSKPGWIRGELSPYSVTCLAFSSDGRLLASAAKDQIQLWQAGDGRLLRTLKGAEFEMMSLALYGKPHPPPASYPGHAGAVTSVALSPNAFFVASGARDQTVRLWEAASGRLLQTAGGAGAGWIQSVAFSPDGRHVAAGTAQGHILIWQCSPWRLVRTWTGHEGQARSVAFSPDGNILASGGGNDQIIRIWAAYDGALLRELKGHTDMVTSVAFFGDGQTLVSGAKDGVARLWPTGEFYEALGYFLAPRLVQETILSLLKEGDGYLGQHDNERAIHCFEEALAAAREIGNRELECMALERAGKAYMAMRKPQEAIPCFEEALRLAQASDFKAEAGTKVKAMLLGQLGNAYNVSEQPQRAMLLYDQAIEAGGPPPMLAEIRFTATVAAIKLGQSAKARQLAEAAARTFEEEGMAERAQQARWLIAQIQRQA